MYEDILTRSFNKKVAGNFIYFIFEGIMMEIGIRENKTIIMTDIQTIEEPPVKYEDKSQGNSFLDLLIDTKG